MRTNIDIDDALLAEARELSNQPTKKGTVEEGLRLLIKLRRQESVRDAFGRYPWSGNLDASRKGRSER
jgi:Arc/MetJ family transcription regulator